MSEGPFHGNRSWKQDVILQMNVAMQIGFHLLKLSIQRSESGTGVLGECVITSYLAKFFQDFPGILVLALHLLDWGANRRETGFRL